MKRRLFLTILVGMLTLTAWGEEKAKPTLIVFGADWCSWCKKAEKDMVENEALRTRLQDFNVIHADYDVDKELVERYNISMVPSFVVIEDGKARKQTGYVKPDKLIKFLNNE